MTEDGNEKFMKLTADTRDKGVYQCSDGTDKSTIINAGLTNINDDDMKRNERYVHPTEQNALPNYEKTSQISKDCPEVLNFLKMNLQGSLNCVNFIKERVLENILAKANEKRSFELLTERSEQLCTQISSDIDIKSADIPKDNSLGHLDDIVNDSNIVCTNDQNTYESEESGKRNLNEHLISNASSETQIKRINQPNSLSAMDCASQEKIIMISLLSEDEELDSDCSKISIPGRVAINNSSCSLSFQEECSSNIENNWVPARNENTAENNDLNETNQLKSIEKRNEFPERRSTEPCKQHTKKKKIINKDIHNQPKEFYFYGDFYKVKLSNLHPRINYGHIVSLLEKAGLEFVDILLVNSDSRPFAEISFIDFASREKALTLDKTLSHLGLKIKIKPI